MFSGSAQAIVQEARLEGAANRQPLVGSFDFHRLSIAESGERLSSAGSGSRCRLTTMAVLNPQTIARLEATDEDKRLRVTL